MRHFLWGLPVEASTYAPSIDFGILLIHAAMILIFVLWGIFFVYLLIRYRQRDGVPAHRDDENHGLSSLIPDIVVMIFEIALIAFYAIPVWSRIKIDFPRPKNANQIDIVAEQFAWDVHYPGPDGKFGRTSPDLVNFDNPVGLDRKDPAAQDDVVQVNELHMPVGVPTLFHLSSKDVIHDFSIPSFRIKQDIVPGMMIPLWVTPTKVGKYELSCAQLCGFGHSLMRADVYVQTPEAYKAWIAAHVPPKPAAPQSQNSF